MAEPSRGENSGSKDASVPPSEPPAGEDAKPAEPAAKATPNAAGQKRPAPDGGPAKAAKRQKVEMTVGDKGVFFTTVNSGSAVNAKRDLQKMLHDLQEPGSTASRPEDAAQASKPKFMPCTEAGKGAGFLKLIQPDAVVPSKVVSQMLEAQRADFQSTGMATASRLLCRVLPLDHTCKPFLEDFRKLAEEVLPPHLGPDAAATTWALEFKARNTNTLKKEAVLEVVDAIVPKGMRICKEDMALQSADTL
ncbi:THUMPD1 [Symbiodinium pilosum]|uniref:THUMPD1 protein n=1 Tax=Symbiodinium pilosum TaxID=2952 RepID=A0A812SKX1_SYMPI|nr:THUMPD1 [Symbiodinium pilosum]